MESIVVVASGGRGRIVVGNDALIGIGKIADRAARGSM